LMDEPREPLARDLRALVGRGQRTRRRACAAASAARRRALHDASTLVLFDDVQLLLDDLIDHVELEAAAVLAAVGAEHVFLRFEVRRQRLAAGGARVAL